MTDAQREVVDDLRRAADEVITHRLTGWDLFAYLDTQFDRGIERSAKLRFFAVIAERSGRTQGRPTPTDALAAGLRRIAKGIERGYLDEWALLRGLTNRNPKHGDFSDG